MENYKQGLKIYTEKIGRETVEVASVIQSMGGIYDVSHWLLYFELTINMRMLTIIYFVITFVHVAMH